MRRQIYLSIVVNFLFLQIIQAQYQPEDLFGLWQITHLGLIDIPATQAAKITIGKGKLLMEMPEGEMDVSATWSLKGDLKTMKVITETEGEELWKVDSLKNNMLFLLDIKSERVMILKRLNSSSKLLADEEEPIDDGSGDYTKIKVAEHELMGRWSFIRAEDASVDAKQGDMIIELLESGIIILSYGLETVEGTWAPADDHHAIDVTVKDNTEKWWLHKFSPKQMQIVDKGALFIFERK